MDKKKRKKNKQLEKCELCMAKKADRQQCTRRRKGNSEYCGKHQNNLKFGRVDDDEKLTIIMDEIDGNSQVGEFTQDEPQQEEEVEDEEV